MAHIKCRYECNYCTNQKSNFYGKLDWYCDNYDFSCDLYEPTDEVVFYTPCDYYEVRHGEFEKNAKGYVYDGGKLTLRGISLEEDEIEYLEIDDRILVNKEDLT